MTSVDDYQRKSKTFTMNVPVVEEGRYYLTQPLIDAFEEFQHTVDIRKGDVIYNEFSGDYRNDGRFIFDGEKLTELLIEPDEYGTATNIVLGVKDVRLDFWFDTIYHNAHIWCDLQEFDPKFKYFVEDTSALYTFEHRGIDYGVIVLRENDIFDGERVYTVIGDYECSTHEQMMEKMFNDYDEPSDCRDTPFIYELVSNRQLSIRARAAHTRRFDW